MTAPTRPARPPRRAGALRPLGDVPPVRPGAVPPDLAALGVWLASRVAVVLLSTAGAWGLAGTVGVQDLLQRWDRWDVGLFRKIAAHGYAGYPQDYPDRGIEALFPGAPLVLRAVHLVVPDWTAAGLLVSLLAGAAASVALGRLAVLEGVSPSRAVLYLVLSPFAVFLFAGYSEALFLALALWGWLCVRQDRWVLGCLLVAGATTVRVSGLFLACGLVVHWAAAGPRRRRTGREVAALAAPFAALAGYWGYLWALTGDPLRWPHAQQEGWGRELTWPWDALRTTLAAAAHPDQTAAMAWSFRAEVLAVLVGVLLTAVLLARRRWGEGVYVGLSVLALATSSFYLSVGRATLLWWSLPLLLAAAAQRRRWVHPVYLALITPLMALLVLGFTAGRWVG